MSPRSSTSTRIVLVVFSLFALATVVVSMSFDLSKFQDRVATEEDQTTLRGISSPAELESALKQHPSNRILQLMAKTVKAADNTKAAIDRLSAQIEPARLSKEPDFGSASREELDSFRRDLGTAEANALAFLPRYAALFSAEHEQIERATVSSHVPKEIADQLLEGVKQRQARTLDAISRILSARADYYRAYDKYIAFLSGELGTFKVVSGQFIFPIQRTVERYNVAAQAMTSAGRRVAELEADLKKRKRPLPEEWMPLTGAK